MQAPDNSQHEIIGSLILRHRDNRAEVRKLEGKLGEIAGQIGQLNRMVADHKDTIHTTPGGFNNDTIPFDIIDSLRAVVTGLQEARAERERIATCMRQTGLEEYINPDGRRGTGNP